MSVLTDFYNTPRQHPKAFFIGFGVGLFACVLAYNGRRCWTGPKKTPNGDKVNKLLAVAFMIMEQSPASMFSTIRSETRYRADEEVKTELLPQTRVMSKDYMELDMKNDPMLNNIFFGTNVQSSKVLDLKWYNNVCITFEDVQGGGYVTLYGKCQCCDNETSIARLKDKWKSFFVNADYRTDFLLLHCTIEFMEIVSYKYKFFSVRKDWKPFVLKKGKMLFLEFMIFTTQISPLSGQHTFKKNNLNRCQQMDFRNRCFCCLKRRNRQYFVVFKVTQTYFLFCLDIIVRLLTPIDTCFKRSLFFFYNTNNILQAFSQMQYFWITLH
ncbi:hypothetical protein RFI_11241 [Reticulomyxa filosa]|uniref:Transmembrane protein n=1 Tax=Reticulomyxa filosa TaxID=46433 RepID=X6NJ35_RETFI|nr:hypothetical protein RFI_11241 [Reticulomyxa filosa]|eukprot:ETO25893.1 hypothetical protein RFI_11241 [Reticulomyxa filosa]